jgi:ABC-2 type transport system ATP-binding protein
VWDQQAAEHWLSRFDVRPDRPCGKLSGGQQTQVALAMAIGSRPEVLLLDEPLASLDPLVRREVMSALLTESAETGMAVLLSTHVVAELGGVAEDLLLLGRGRLLLSGEIDELLTSHAHYAGPRAEAPPAGEVLRESHHEQQSTFLVKLSGNPGQPGGPWVTQPATVEDIVLAHLSNVREGGTA